MTSVCHATLGCCPQWSNHLLRLWTYLNRINFVVKTTDISFLIYLVLCEKSCVLITGSGLNLYLYASVWIAETCVWRICVRSMTSFTWLLMPSFQAVVHVLLPHPPSVAEKCFPTALRQFTRQYNLICVVYLGMCRRLVAFLANLGRQENQICGGWRALNTHYCL